MNESEYLKLRLDLAEAEAALARQALLAHDARRAEGVVTLRNRVAEAEAQRAGGAALRAFAAGLRPQIEKAAAGAFSIRLKMATVCGRLAEIGSRERNPQRWDELATGLCELSSQMAVAHGRARDCETLLGVEVARLALPDTPEAQNARAAAGLADSRWLLPDDETPTEARAVLGWALGKATQYHRP